MKLPVAVMLAATLVLTACGHDGGNDFPPVFTTQILSDATFDGDIAQDPVLATMLTVTQAIFTQNVFAGIDPVSSVEYRGFLDFPLAGPGGVPLNAGIFSASLDIFIDDIQPTAGTIPIRIDLVSFQPPDLIGTDFDLTQQPALATITFPIFQTDFNQHVVVDVTSLMKEAQRQGLPDFQVRIMEDLGPVIPGLIVIDDTTTRDRELLAPLLEVRYF